MFRRRSSSNNASKETDFPPHPGPDADGASRVIPKEIWDGPQGDFLREIGASPDDASNLVPTQELIQARFDKLREEQEAFVAALNTEMPAGVKVGPWAMIPWTVWSQQHADFLLGVCELFPVGPWNTLLLPEDERGALILDLPQHLGGIPAGLEDAANRLIGEIREEHRKVHDRTGAALAESNLSSLDEYEKATKEACAKVMGVAHWLGAKTYGEEAYARHKVVFGATLGWNTASQ